MDRSHGDEIARFVDGTMSLSERTAFESRLAKDAGLRRLVDAERAIRSTISGELASMPAEHAATRSHMMSALASLPSVPAPRVAPPRGPMQRSPLLKWLGAAGLAVAVSVGGYLAGTRDAGRERVDARDTVVSPPSPAIAPSAPADTRASASEAIAPDVAGSTPTAPRHDSAQRAARRGNEPPTPVTTSARGDAEPATTETHAAEPEPAIPVTPKKELRVIDRDSVKIRVGVDDVR